MRVLATQTTAAIDEIPAQVDATQHETAQAVTAIHGVVATIESLSSTTTSAASVVEQQEAATK